MYIDVTLYQVIKKYKLILFCEFNFNNIIINQRYGWHGRNDDNLQDNFDNALGRYPWLENFRDKSVTELEFLHGHLNNPGALPAVICFRDKVHYKQHQHFV